jgi:hypothetical protein
MTREPETACLYDCVVMHQRVSPKQHHLRYKVFSLFVDLGSLSTADSGCRLLSWNRWNLLSFYERDHGDGRASGLASWARETLAAAGLGIGSGRIRLLTFPRMLGFVFNPLSVYFCDDEVGALRAIIYEVNNTFGQRHFYVLPADRRLPDGAVEQQCRKTLYVSPFNGTAGDYRFRTRPPGETVALAIEHRVAGELVLRATQIGSRRILTDGALLRTLAVYPWMTAKVVAAIHWEALKLWLKKVPLVPRPLPPVHNKTTGTSITG